jgi:hypothetical protein
LAGKARFGAARCGVVWYGGARYGKVWLFYRKDGAQMQQFECADGSKFTAHEYAKIYVVNEGKSYYADAVGVGDIVRLSDGEIKEITAAYNLPDDRWYNWFRKAI